MKANSYKVLLVLVVLVVGSRVCQCQDVMNYYELINKARLLSCTDSSCDASSTYVEAFNKWGKPNLRDIINAAEVTAQCGDTLLFFELITLAAKRGLDLKMLNLIKAFEPYRNHQLFEAFINNQYQYHEEYMDDIDLDVRKEINQMFSDDQAIRKRYYNTFFLFRRKKAKEWEALNTKQVEHIVEIIREKGFPGEGLIGVDKHEMHPKIDILQASAGMPVLIFIHHYSQPNESLDSLLFQEVLAGNLLNEHYAAICDYEAEFGRDKHKINGYYAWKHKPKAMDRSAIDLKRETIRLPKIEEIQIMNLKASIQSFWKRLY